MRVLVLLSLACLAVIGQAEDVGVMTLRKAFRGGVKVQVLGDCASSCDAVSCDNVAKGTKCTRRCKFRGNNKKKSFNCEGKCNVVGTGGDAHCEPTAGATTKTTEDTSTPKPAAAAATEPEAEPEPAVTIKGCDERLKNECEATPASNGKECEWTDTGGGNMGCQVKRSTPAPEPETAPAAPTAAAEDWADKAFQKADAVPPMGELGQAAYNYVKEATDQKDAYDELKDNNWAVPATKTAKATTTENKWANGRPTLKVEQSDSTQTAKDIKTYNAGGSGSGSGSAENDVAEAKADEDKAKAAQKKARATAEAEEKKAKAAKEQADADAAAAAAATAAAKAKVAEEEKKKVEAEASAPAAAAPPTTSSGDKCATMCEYTNADWGHCKPTNPAANQKKAKGWTAENTCKTKCSKPAKVGGDCTCKTGSDCSN